MSAAADPGNSDGGVAPEAPGPAGSVRDADTFGAWLAARSDDELLQLLEARPDVSVPPPSDFDVLARRLAASPSVARALERVNRFGLELLEALSYLGRRVATEQLASAAGLPVGDLVAELDRLRRLGLIWGDAVLHLPPGVADEVGPHPLGVGRPARELLPLELTAHEQAIVAANLELPLPASPPAARVTAAITDFFDDAVGLHAVLQRLGEPERRLLTQLANGSPLGFTGASAPAIVPADDAGTALARLVCRGLLVPVGPDLVELPREVAVALRTSHPADAEPGASPDPLLDGRLHNRPPELAGRTWEATEVDGAAATGASEFLRRIESLLERWDETPPVLTRSGGLPVRELRAAAKALDLTADEVAVLAELARGSSLLAVTPGHEAVVLPTELFDEWQSLPADQRWAALATGWMELDGFPGLATTVQPDHPGEDGGAAAAKPVPVFSWGLRRTGAAAQRREILDVLATAPVGLAPEPTTLLERLSWLGPRRSEVWRRAVAAWTLSEAELLGVTGRGALSGVGRTLLHDGGPAAAGALGALLPSPVDHLLIQGDLTAVAPGPLEPMLAKEVRLVADVESAGAATVFRFSEASLRRALDAGWSGADVQDLLRRCARGSVPQSLSYLVDDVARRHGRLRAGSVSSYVRCEDPALLAEVVAAKRTAPAALRPVAPTVAVSPAPLERVLEVLRAAGYAPAGEGADGSVRIERPPAERIPVPARRSGYGASTLGTVGYGGLVPRDHLTSTVLRLRRAETAARAARERAPRTAVGSAARDPGAILSRLTDAVAGGRALEMSYVNLEGRASTRVVHPLLLSGGYLTGYDEQSGERRTFAVSRISRLVELGEVS